MARNGIGRERRGADSSQGNGTSGVNVDRRGRCNAVEIAGRELFSPTVAGKLCLTGYIRVSETRAASSSYRVLNYHRRIEGTNACLMFRCSISRRQYEDYQSARAIANVRARGRVFAVAPLLSKHRLLITAIYAFNIVAASVLNNEISSSDSARELGE